MTDNVVINQGNAKIGPSVFKVDRSKADYQRYASVEIALELIKQAVGSNSGSITSHLERLDKYADQIEAAMEEN